MRPHRYRLFIKATPEQVWQGITDPDFTERYFHETRFTSTLEPGSGVRYVWNGEDQIVGEVLAVMKQLSAEGMTMIVVTHEMGFAREAADSIIFMDAGKIVETSSPDEFFAKPKTERARQFLQRYVR